MIIDEVDLKVKAGNGGHGAVSFRREKYVPKGGPDGGNGGKGGDIYFVGSSDLSALNQFRNKKEIKGENGINGGKKKKDGANGDDIFISIPVGTIITDTNTTKSFEIKTAGKKYLIAKGGKGGLGSYELRSPSNTTPRVAEDGKPGEERHLTLNLQYIADIGLIGLPNSGKSSLLNSLTNADAKIGNYSFTTLEPNLGNLEGIIIADIPGLIEGAHTGKGLGIRFLKHIQKTSLLIHCIDGSSSNILADYKIIRNELASFSPSLLDKKEIILLTKTDLIDERMKKSQMKKLSTKNKNTVAVSLADDVSISSLKKYIHSFLS
jgi:GTP-binding protein